MIKAVKWNFAWDLLWFSFTFGWFFYMKGQDDGICFVPKPRENEDDDFWDTWQCYLAVECLFIAVVIFLPLMLCKVCFLLSKNAMLRNLAKFAFLHKLMLVYYSVSSMTFRILAICYWKTSLLLLGLANYQFWTYPFWVFLNISLWVVGLFGTTLYIFELILWLNDKCSRSSSNQLVAPTEASVLADGKAKTKKQSRFARAFDPFKFSEHTECVICLMDFEKNEMVTALPCDVRHYFHAECISSWSKKNSTCPLCKTPFSVAAIREFNNKLTL